MTPNYEVIGAIVTGLVAAGVYIGKQLAKVLTEKAKNIERDFRIDRLEEDVKEIKEEQQYNQRHRH